MKDTDNKIVIFSTDEIQNMIYSIRGLQVMLDEDLAVLYGVETKRLNEQVRRNSDRFPHEFCFQLSKEELDNLKSQFATSRWGGRRYLPYAFTEQGVAMLSAVLRSDTAVNVSIQIMNAFVNMRKFITANAQVFQRIDSLEKKQLEHKIESDEKFEKIFKAIEEKEITPKQGIFFDGQIFDAHTFVSDIIRSAKESIALIDNYIDDTVLTLLTKRKKNVSVTIYTKTISKRLVQDVEKYNDQYPRIQVKKFEKAHDRFIIIDDKDVYHLGASLKDLGKKWFAFSKFDSKAFSLIEKIKKVNSNGLIR